MSRNARFVILDGTEGVGKSTQLKRLKEHFGDRVVFTREPGGSPYAEEIRDVVLNSQYAGEADALTHFSLFWAARSDHMQKTVIPALEAGKHVISDRFDSTTFAFQIRGQEHAELYDLFFRMREQCLGDVQPDRYILFDLDPEIGLTRKAKQKDELLNHFDARDLAFHNRNREGFKEFADHVPHVFIDASKAIDEVTQDLLAILKQEFNDEN